MISRHAFLLTLTLGAGLATALPTFAQAVDCSVNPDSTCLGPTFLHPNYTPVAKAADATHAGAADQAANAGHASVADSATVATSAQTAVTAQSATTAGTASVADLALQANQAAQASVALQADVATLATNATHATIADQATTAANTMYAWASGNTTVFPDPTSANNYAQAQADAQNAIYLQDVGCQSVGGGCVNSAAATPWAGSAEWDTYQGATFQGGQPGAPCLSIYQDVHSSMSGVTCELFVAAVITPPTTTVVQGITYYAPHFNPGWINPCLINPASCQTTDPGGNGGGDGSGPGGGDGGGGTGGGGSGGAGSSN